MGPSIGPTRCGSDHLFLLTPVPRVGCTRIATAATRRSPCKHIFCPQTTALTTLRLTQPCEFSLSVRCQISAGDKNGSSGEAVAVMGIHVMIILLVDHTEQLQQHPGNFPIRLPLWEVPLCTATGDETLARRQICMHRQRSIASDSWSRISLEWISLGNHYPQQAVFSRDNRG